MFPPPRLLKRALLYNLDGHRANPANLIAGALGMFINNIIFFVGIWGMLFAGKTQNQEQARYFVALYVVVTLSWGALVFFYGGLRSLGDSITDGTLEPMLGTPRSPLALVGMSKSYPMALGDFVMGLMGLGLLAWMAGPAFALRAALAAVISFGAFAGVFVLSGSIAFFVARGNMLSFLLQEITLSLSVYPTGKMFPGTGRLALMLTPAAATAILPLEWVESAGWEIFGLALFAVSAWISLSLFVFKLGLRRYQTVSLIGAQS